MKRVLMVLLLGVLATVAIHTFRASTRYGVPLGERKKLLLDSMAAKNLQEAVGIQSVSFDDTVAADHTGIDSLIGFLNRKYPTVFSALECDTINRHSLLLCWHGSKGSKVLKPVIFYAHMDVVPAESDTSNGWRFPVFGNELIGDTIRGRGAVDDKIGVIGILEAVNRLLERSFKPKRDIYLAFGHDEEIGGLEGAAKIADELRSRGVKAEWLLDEGGMVAEGIVPFVDRPVALVMTAEKGYMTVDLSVEGEGGHSSFPPEETPIDILSAAIMRLEEHPMPRTICEPVARFMDHAGPAMRFPFNAVFANRWLFSSVIMGEYEKIPEGNATIRTTLAWTMTHAGVKENVIPARATATANLRIIPGSSIQETMDALKKTINDDRVGLVLHPGHMEPVPASGSETGGFGQISAAIHSVFPDAIVAPNLSIASTDSRHFSKVTEQRYRFLPVRMDRGILSGMHGKNERISVTSFMETIGFYEALMGAQ